MIIWIFYIQYFTMVERKTTKTTTKTTKAVKSSEKVEAPKKRATATRKPKVLVLEVANQWAIEHEWACSCGEKCHCHKGHGCWKLIRIIELVLLVANLILLCVLICKVNKVNDWTVLGNWWEENFEILEDLYQTEEYKTYVHGQIGNLEATLTNYNAEAYDYDYSDENIE